MLTFHRILTVGVLLGCLNVTLVNGDPLVAPNEARHCYSCAGINCQRTSLVNVTTQCADQLDICVTIFEDNTVVAKGCYTDIPEAQRAKCQGDHHSPECVKCFDQLCNNKGRADFQCIQCDASDNSKCIEDTSDMSPVQCDIPTAPNSYCYVDFVNGHIKRGCYTRLEDQLGCLKNPMCSLCLSSDGEACNTYNMFMVSGANSRTPSVVTATLAALISVVVVIFK